MTHTESKIQADIVKALQTAGVFCHSVPNEKAGRSAVSQMQLITMGLRPGAGDLVVWFPTPSGIKLGYIEVKTPTGRLSDHQVKFQARCHLAGVPYFVCRSVEDAFWALQKMKDDDTIITEGKNGQT